MISSIGFKNYKAFASGELAFKPITILLGANSVANLFRDRNTAKPIELSIGLDNTYTHWLRRRLLESMYKRLEIEYRKLERMGYDGISQELKGKNFIRYIAESEANFKKICDLTTVH